MLFWWNSIGWREKYFSKAKSCMRMSTVIVISDYLPTQTLSSCGAVVRQRDGGNIRSSLWTGTREGCNPVSLSVDNRNHHMTGTRRQKTHFGNPLIRKTFSRSAGCALPKKSNHISPLRMQIHPVHKMVQTSMSEQFLRQQHNNFVHKVKSTPNFNQQWNQNHKQNWDRDQDWDH